MKNGNLNTQIRPAPTGRRPRCAGSEQMAADFFAVNAIRGHARRSWLALRAVASKRYSRGILDGCLLSILRLPPIF